MAYVVYLIQPGNRLVQELQGFLVYKKPSELAPRTKRFLVTTDKAAACTFKTGLDAENFAFARFGKSRVVSTYVVLDKDTETATKWFTFDRFKNPPALQKTFTDADGRQCFAGFSREGA